jgi:hypothetical protein
LCALFPKEELNLEYKRYLQEVVETLETDPDFRKKLETAEEADFRVCIITNI